MVIYEFPVNNRVRTFLRLEYLFERLALFSTRDEPQDHHVALAILFDIIEVAERSDIKLDLTHELEYQRKKLIEASNYPETSNDKLEQVLNENEIVTSAILNSNGKPGYLVRENSWLSSIKYRMNIPGGVCSFDLPLYHLWLNSDATKRREDIDEWFKPLLPFKNAIANVLHILRSSGASKTEIAHQGMFQQMMKGRVVKLISLKPNTEEPCVPEVSANRHALNIRFLTPDMDGRSKCVDADIEFDLTLSVSV